MSELFERLSQPSTWVKPETMLVLKSTKRNYPAYYNAYKKSFGGLLEATIYTDNEIPEIPDTEAVDYRDICGIKK